MKNVKHVKQYKIIYVLVVIVFYVKIVVKLIYMLGKVVLVLIWKLVSSYILIMGVEGKFKLECILIVLWKSLGLIVWIWISIMLMLMLLIRLFR